MTKKRLRSIAITALKFGIAGVLLYVGFSKQSFDRGMLSGLLVRWPYALAGTLGMLFIPLLGTLRWLILVRPQGIELRLGQAARLTYIGFFWSVFLPGAITGDFFKAYYVARGQGRQKKAEAVTTVFLDRVAGLFGLALLAAVVLVINIRQILADPTLKTICIIVAALFAAQFTTFTILLHPKLRAYRKANLQRRGHIWQVVDRIDDAVQIYRHRKMTILMALALSVMNHLLQSLVLWHFATALDANIPIQTMLLLAPIGFIVNAVPIAPGGMGQGELFFKWLVATTHGFGGGLIIFFSWRLANLIAVSPGAIIWAIHRHEYKDIEDSAQSEEDAEAGTADGPPPDPSAPAND